MSESAIRAGIVFTLVMFIVSGLSIGFAPMPGHAMLAPSDQAASTPAQRGDDLAKVQGVLEAKIVQQRLADLGYSADEISAKLNRLSDSQLHQVASQIDSLFPAGFHGATDDFLHIALSVLLIVVIVAVIFAII